MFLCKKCHKKDKLAAEKCVFHPRPHLAQSYGKCEACHEVANCSDCKPSE